MRPLFADAIDFPIVFGYGLAVLVPLLLFEVVAEAAILKKTWNIPFRELCRFTFRANCWSLLAGIPIKMFNGWLYYLLLPDDLPGYFKRYPYAVAIGSLVYFLGTVLVEGGCAFRWLRREGLAMASDKVWKGILLANLATYVVLSPLYYHMTRPTRDIRTFTTNAGWSAHPDTKIIYIDASDNCLKTVRLNGANPETLFPLSANSYLLSPDLNLCLIQATNGNLSLYRHGAKQSDFIYDSDQRSGYGIDEKVIDQAAFSPLGQYVAFAHVRTNLLEVLNVRTGQRISQAIPAGFDHYSNAALIWSTNEFTFYLGGFQNGSRFSFTIQADGKLETQTLSGTDQPPLFACYSRPSKSGWPEPNERVSNQDSYGDLTAWAEPGLGSGLIVYRNGHWRDKVAILAVDPGMIHLPQFWFHDVAFLPDGDECLFEANGYIYLLNIPEKKVGMVTRGERFILLTPRYQKQL